MVKGQQFCDPVRGGDSARISFTSYVNAIVPA